MNIVLATGIYPPESGGPATFVQDLAKRLLADGHVVRLVTYGDRRTNRSLGIETVIERGNSVLYRYVRYAVEVWKAAKTADMVFAQGPLSEGVPARIAAALLRKPFVLKVVGDVAWESAQRGGYTADLDFFLEEHVHGKIPIIRWLQGLVARTSERVIVPSKYLQGVVMKWGVNERKTEVIYNAVRVHQPIVSERELRLHYQLEQKRILLAGGRLVPWKNIGFLLEIMAQRPESEVLVVVGSGPAEEGWRQRALQLGIENRVVWTGALSAEEMTSWYACADVFLLPSLYEGLSHMLLEAAMHGVASIASPAGGNAEGRQLFPERVEIVPLDVRQWSVSLDRAHRSEGDQVRAVWSKEEQYRAYLAVLATMVT